MTALMAVQRAQPLAPVRRYPADEAFGVYLFCFVFLLLLFCLRGRAALRFSF